MPMLRIFTLNSITQIGLENWRTRSHAPKTFSSCTTKPSTSATQLCRFGCSPSPMSAISAPTTAAYGIRELAIHPDLAKEHEWRSPITPRNDRIFYVLLMIRHMLDRIGGGAEWTAQISLLLEPVCQSNRWHLAMGVPSDWRVHPIWSKR
jgi:hypothetical protein